MMTPKGRGPRNARLVYVVTAPVSAQALLRGQLEWMDQRGYDVHLITSEGPGLDEVRARRCATVHLVDFRREISPLRDLLALVQLTLLLHRLRPDIVNYSTPKASLLTSLAARALGIPRRVYVVRGLRLEGARSRLKRFVLITSERTAIRSATDVFAVSPSLARALQTHNLAAPGKVRVPGPGSSNGVDVSRSTAVVPERVATLRADLGLSADDVLVGYVGRIAEDKGLGELCSALQHHGLRDAHLLTVGKVEDPGLAARLAALGRRWHHVDFTPHVLEHMACSDVFALPTYREGFPNVVLEASSLGIPVVTTTATGAVDSVVTEETGLLVPPGEVEPLAAALERLVRDPRLRRTLGEGGRRFAARFDPHDVWRAYELAYEKVAQ